MVLAKTAVTGQVTAWAHCRRRSVARRRDHIRGSIPSGRSAVSTDASARLGTLPVSATASLNIRSGFGLFVSALKIPFPGNRDFGSKRLGSNTLIIAASLKHSRLGGEICLAGCEIHWNRNVLVDDQPFALGLAQNVRQEKELDRWWAYTRPHSWPRSTGV
jgi:hypothetical protein